MKVLRLKTSSMKIKIKSLAVFALSAKLVMQTRRSRVSHLHAHFATFPSLLAWIISQHTDLTFSLTAHAHDIYVNQDILSLIAEDASFIVAISKFNADFICEKIGDWVRSKIFVIHCGIDISKFEYRDQLRYMEGEDGDLVILSIGRLSGIKGFKYLIDSCKALDAEGVNFRCLIAGDGPLKKELKAQIKSLGLEEKVEFLGPQTSDNIRGLFEGCHIFVLACATDNVEGHDGIPIVFMEAMASGVPVIGTSLSGIPELIKDGDTGICAKPEDPESLKNAIVFLIEKPSEVERMRCNARKLIEREFNISKNAKKLRERFKRVLFQGEN